MANKKIKVGIFSSRFNDDPVPFINKTTQILEKLNVEVDNSYFNKNSNQDKQDFAAFLKRIEKVLNNNDFLIFDNSKYNNGISFIIGRATRLKKPMLVLYNKNTKERNPSSVIRAYSHYRRYFYQEYTEDILEGLITEFITNAQKLLNTQFLFHLDNEMAEYLKWDAEHYSRKKVDTMRSLVSKQMEDNEEWIEHKKRRENID